MNFRHSATAFLLILALAWLASSGLGEDAMQRRVVLGNLENDLGNRDDLNDDLDSHRTLSPKDAPILLEVSDVLIDPRARNRHQAAKCLGLLGHSACLPVLAAILRDESEDPNVRHTCASALFGIADLRRVDIAISQLHEENIDIWTQVAWVLKEVKGSPKNPRPRIVEFPKTAAERILYQAKWKEWWESARTTVEAPKRYRYSNPYTNGFPAPMPWFGE